MTSRILPVLFPSFFSFSVRIQRTLSHYFPEYSGYRCAGKPLNHVVSKESLTKEDKKVLQLLLERLGKKISVQSLVEKMRLSLGACFAQAALFAIHVHRMGVQLKLSTLFQNFQPKRDALIQMIHTLDGSELIQTRNPFELISMIFQVHPHFPENVSFQRHPIFSENTPRDLRNIIQGRDEEHLILCMTSRKMRYFHGIYLFGSKREETFLAFDSNLGARKSRDLSVFSKNLNRDLQNKYGELFFWEVIVMKIWDKRRSRL